MRCKFDGSHLLGRRLAGVLGFSFLPAAAALAHGPGGGQVQSAGWILAIAPQAIVTLSLGFVLGILAVAMRRAAWARVGLAAIAVALPLTSFTQIAVIPVPHIFADGEPARASEVNANFQAVVQQIANHANNGVLHGGGGTVTSVDGLLGGTITGDITIDGGRLIVDEVALRDNAGELQLFLGVSDAGDGFLAYIDKGALLLSPNGDSTLIGPGNAVIQSFDGSIQLFGGENGSINIVSANSTNMLSNGRVSIDGTTIELNAPNN